MSEVRISVVIPTTGRDTLRFAQQSAADADEVITVPDTTGDNGYTPRTKGMLEASGTHVAFLDDDDVYAPEAIDLMRGAACDVPVIFRMDHPYHGVLWRERQLRFGNVGTPMFLVPNRPDKFGEWAPHNPKLKEPGGDFTFITGCVEKMGGPVWREEVVCIVRPHERKSVAVITPWMNHLELAEDYFAALDAGPYPDEVIIVDNASEPPLDFAAIRSHQNLGFAKGSNAGLDAAESDVVVFLNNDIAATRQGWLWKLVQATEPGVLVGAQMRYDAHANVDGHSFPYLDGWCLAGMRDDFVDLGGFDELLEEPSYYSDNILCLKARAEGFTLREVKVGLFHKSGKTSNANGYILPSTAANRLIYEAQARDLMGVAA